MIFLEEDFTQAEYDRLAAQGKPDAELSEEKHMPGHHDQMSHSSGKGSGKGGGYSAAQYDADGHIVPGSVGGLSGVDFSKHTAGTPKTKAWLNNWLKKVDKLEKLAEEGDWDAFEKNMSKNKNPKGINKKIAKVQQNLLDMKAKGLFGLPDGAIASDPPEIADGQNWKKIGGKLGTEKGGTYMMGGKKYYVKIPDDPERARNEVLTAKLYELAGGGTKKMHLVDIDGKVGVAGEWLDDSAKPNWNSVHAQSIAGKDFAVHAWLNNRDAVGAGSENPMDNIHWKDKSKTGMVAIDVGGGLDWKGGGGAGKKNFDAVASEFESLRDPSKNETMAKVFGEMSHKEIQHTASKLKNVKDKDIDKLVDQFGSSDDAHRASIKALLKSRRDSIIKKAGVEDEKPVAPKTHTAMPPEPVFQGTEVGLTTAKMKLKVIKQYINEGSLDKLQTVATGGLTTKAGQAVHAYKEAAKAAMKSNQSPTVKPSNVKPKAEPKPIKIDPNKFPEQPEFHSDQNATHAAINKGQLQKAGIFALKGNISQLQSMIATGEVKSPKVKNHINALINNVESQLNPPAPPKPMSETSANLVNSIQSAKGQKGLSKVGKWDVLGSIAEEEGKGAHTPINILDWSNADALHEAGSKAFKKAVGHKTAIKSYTGSGYGPMNRVLRQEETGSADTSKRAHSVAIGVHKYSIPIDPGVTVTRKHSGDMSGMKPGLVVSDKGVMSTTSDPYGKMSGNNLWKITAGEGVKGLPVDKHSANGGEKEVLLPSNQRLLVTRVQKKSDKGMGKFDAPGTIDTIIFATALPTLEGQCCPP